MGLDRRKIYERSSVLLYVFFILFVIVDLLLQDGYREGIPEGKLSTLQAGFDNGFTLSAPLARQLGSLRAQSSSLLALLHPPPSLRPKLPSLPSVSPSLSEEITQDVKALIRELSGVRMVDIVGRDREAEEHSKEHGIEIPEEDRQEGDDEDGERKIGEWKKQLQGLREKAGLFPIRMNR